MSSSATNATGTAEFANLPSSSHKGTKPSGSPSSNERSTASSSLDEPDVDGPIAGSLSSFQALYTIMSRKGGHCNVTVEFSSQVRKTLQYI